MATSHRNWSLCWVHSVMIFTCFSLFSADGLCDVSAAVCHSDAGMGQVTPASFTPHLNLWSKFSCCLFSMGGQYLFVCLWVVLIDCIFVWFVPSSFACLLKSFVFVRILFTVVGESLPSISYLFSFSFCRLFVRSFVCLFVCLFVGWFVRLFVCLFACLLVCLFVCLFVCLLFSMPLRLSRFDPVLRTTGVRLSSQNSTCRRRARLKTAALAFYRLVLASWSDPEGWDTRCNIACNISRNTRIAPRVHF